MKVEEANAARRFWSGEPMILASRGPGFYRGPEVERCRPGRVSCIGVVRNRRQESTDRLAEKDQGHPELDHRLSNLISRFMRLPRYQTVLVPYMGHLDVLLLWPFAKLKGSQVAWDIFISLYNTIVEDRQMFSNTHPVSRLIYVFEWLASRAADRMLMDTRAHADYFVRRYHLPDERLGAVFVGAEVEHFPLLKPLGPKESSEPITILFYGQFIPLHGIRTIVEAARELDDGTVRWVLIGRGQEEGAIRQELDANPVKHLEWLSWVRYQELVDWIARADICLGIFSKSEKAASVIPNKAFQVISSGRPLITRDSPAIRELVSEDEPGIFLVSPEDSPALVDAIKRFRKERPNLVGRPLFENLRKRISAQATGVALCAELGLRYAPDKVMQSGETD